MRTEYALRITDNKGNVKISTYAKSVIEERYNEACKFWRDVRGFKVEMVKSQWIGQSFVKGEVIK